MTLEPLNESHLKALLPFVKEYHAFERIHMSDAGRREAVRPLLADARLGAVWAVAEAGEWAGYVALTHGYSIEFRGRDAFIDELYIREAFRGRGIGTRVLGEVKAWAARTGIRTLLDAHVSAYGARFSFSGPGYSPRPSAPCAESPPSERVPFFFGWYRRR